MIDTITQLTTTLPEELTTILLLLLIAIVFVIAYKTLAIVTQTLIISALSAGFYLTLWYLEFMPFSIQNTLLFAFLGAALYLGFTLLQTAYSILKTTIKIPVGIVETFYKITRKITNTLKGLLSSKKTKTKTKKKEKDEQDDNTKEVVIDKVNREEKDKED